MSAMDLVATVPSTSWVTPRLAPVSIRKVPRVTMKLGSRVLDSAQPLKRPTARVTPSETATPTQVTAVNWYDTMDEVSAAVVTSTPAERSNSPPIISSATGTAMIPMVDAEYSTVPSAPAVRKVVVTALKKANTTAAPTSAPTPGPPTSRRAAAGGGSRSSRRPAVSRSPGGALTWSPGRRTGPASPPPCGSGSAVL